jgi:hypothetical protein
MCSGDGCPKARQCFRFEPNEDLRNKVNHYAFPPCNLKKGTYEFFIEKAEVIQNRNQNGKQ